MKRTVSCNWLSLDRTSLLRSVWLIALGVVMAGCSGGNTATQQNVTIRGSNTIGEELAPRLIAEYKKEHSAVAFDLEFKGTQYGMGALMAGRCDISAASREPTKNENEMDRSRGIEFNDYVIGTYSVAVIVNGGNPVANLTTDQVRDIFTGAIENWKDVGGPDAPIHLYVRDPISGTYLGFQELAMEKKPYALSLKTFTTYADIVQAVAQDAGGIGYSSIELTKKPNVKAVSIGGVAPTTAAVNQSQYPYARVLRLYTSKTNETSATHEFVQFIQSSRGQKILDDMGFVPKS
jgi:phosphate transport system substrate-binding protein